MNNLLSYCGLVDTRKSASGKELPVIRIMYKWGYVYHFYEIFQGLRLFKGVRLLQTQEYVLSTYLVLIKIA